MYLSGMSGIIIALDDVYVPEPWDPSEAKLLDKGE